MTFDLGNLAAFDTRPIDPKKLKGGGEKYLLERATERATKLIHKIFALPDAGRPKDGGRLVSLPDTVTPLPREKPVPKPKPQTRWEAFAEKKGIVKKKRSRMVFDEESDSYKPRYGYGAVDKDGTEDSFIEYHASMDKDLAEGNDPFIVRQREKQERVSLNKKQNAANKRRAMAESMSTMGATVHELSLNKDFKEKTKTQLDAAFDVARASTASVGKFDQKLQDEPKVRGGKRKFAAVVDEPPPRGAKRRDGSSARNEQQQNLALLSRMLGAEGGGDSVLNQSKAIKSVHDQVGAQTALDEREQKRAKKIFKKKERGLKKKAQKKKRG